MTPIQIGLNLIMQLYCTCMTCFFAGFLPSNVFKMTYMPQCVPNKNRLCFDFKNEAFYIVDSGWHTELISFFFLDVPSFVS